MDVRDLARDERVDLTAFLATLPPQQWRAPTPCDLGEEVLGWLRRAYDENAAPPGPRRPARRPPTEVRQVRTGYIGLNELIDLSGLEPKVIAPGAS